MINGVYTSRGKNLKEIPKEVFSEKDLFYLDLSNNEIEVIPVEISQLSNLKFLYLSGNNISQLPTELATLRKLEVIDISNNKIKTLPDIFDSLNEITNIYLSNNPITSLPKSFFSLTKLRSLNLTNLRLSAILPEIGLLKNLEYLDLRHNSAKKLPESIGNLADLKILNICYNNIDRLPTTIGKLHKLETLDISNNSIKKIPSVIGFIKTLDKLYHSNNPIISPPLEVLDRGIKEIQSFLRTKHEDESEEYMFEAKLLLVGAGEVGKTSLIKRILYDTFAQIDMTHGIEINKWLFKTDNQNDFTVNIWDFGGQEIFHATHKFFLTKRSLYVFVWDARMDDELITFDYWLNIVSLLSNNSPVIVVLNKIDERHKSINEEIICEKFKNVVSFLKTSAKTGEGIKDLEINIKKQIQKLEHIGELLPTRYFLIRKTLEELDKNYISYSEFISICQLNKLEVPEADTLLGYFHDLGIILHFHDSSRLRDTVFLKPEWVTQAVYILTDSIELQKKNGRFTYDDLNKYWKNYPQEKYIQLLELMFKFELCLEKQDMEEYYITELLSAEKLDFNWHSTNNLNYIYQYVFMPPGILSRLIVRMKDLIYKNIFWRYGMVLYRNGTFGLIISNIIERKIEIKISGNDKKELLSIIKREIDVINQTWNNPEVSELIPCPCKTCKSTKKSHFYDYSNLFKALKKRINTIQCPISFDNVPISEILKDFTIETPKGNDSIYNYYMKIEKIETGANNTIYIAEHISDPINIVNVVPQNIEKVLKELNKEQMEILKDIYSAIMESEDHTKLSRLDEFIQKHILPLSYSVSGAALFDMLKNAF
jgi:small GTP-binding protein